VVWTGTGAPLSSNTSPAPSSVVFVLLRIGQANDELRPNRLARVTTASDAPPLCDRLNVQPPPSAQLRSMRTSLTAPKSCVIWMAAFCERAATSWLPRIAIRAPDRIWIASLCVGPPPWFGSDAKNARSWM
jgi:hypothetical protein